MVAARPASALPSPPGLPVLGHTAAFARDPLGFMERTVRDCGDMVATRVGPISMVLVSDPALIEAVLVKTRDGVRKDRVTQALSVVLGQGLLTAEGERWRRNRKLAAPSFQRTHIAAYAEAFVDETRTWVESLPRWSRRDLHADFTGVTLAIVVRTLFGASWGGDPDQVGGIMDELMREVNVEIFSPRRALPHRIPTPGRLRLRAAGRRLNALLQPLIAERRRTGAVGDDLLSRLVAARDEDGHALDDEQLRDEVITLFLAGHETTALALSYASWLLGGHPDVLARAHAEVDAVCPDRDPQLGDLDRLPFLGAIVSEALRLYPPDWAIGRELLVDLDLGGVTIPKGWEVTVAQWIVHRDPRWYSTPLAFRPDRWLSGELDDNPRYAYFPFGGGPRVCVGAHFARMEAILCLATLLRHLDLRAVPGVALDLDPSITLRPKRGVWLDVARRGAGGPPLHASPPVSA